jgi:hypothetical protein
VIGLAPLPVPVRPQLAGEALESTAPRLLLTVNVMHLSLVTASFLLLTAACGSDDDEAVPGPELSAKEALLIGNGLASKVAQHAWLSRELVVQGVYEATRLGGGLQTGQVVKHGTLKAGLFGGFQYAPTPEDRLVVELQGVAHEFEVGEVKGNMEAQTPAAFLNSNHDMEYLHRVPDVSEMEVRANRVGMGWASKLSGSYSDEGRRYELDLKAEGGNYFEQGGRSGQESKTDYRITGTMSAESVRLTVDERHFFHLVSVGDAVTHSIDENRNTLKTGESEYRWVDTIVTKIFRTAGGRMMPVFDAAEKWEAKGKVQKNGDDFGSFRLGVGGKSVDVNRKYHGTIDIEIKIPDGVVTLQSFRGS